MLLGNRYRLCEPLCAGGMAQIFLGQVADALSMCHRPGILHGDIKPENIMVDSSGCVKLVDCGFSSPDGAWVDRPLIGSPHDVAPERLLGGPLTAPTALVRYHDGAALVRAIDRARDELLGVVVSEPPAPEADLCSATGFWSRPTGPSVVLRSQAA